MKFLNPRAVALIGVLTALTAAVSVKAADLTLEAAAARVSAVHPDLRSFAARRRALEAEAVQARLRPALGVGVEVENVLGSDAYADTGEAETTLTLSGLLERGGKRAARGELAASRFDELAVEREAKELDVLAEVARRYLDLAEAQARVPSLERALDRQRQLAKAVRRRFEAGASPEALALSAEAEIGRRETELAAALRQVDVAWRALALMWADSAPGPVPQLSALPSSSPSLQPLETLLAKLRQSPDIRYFAEAERVQDARRRLAASARSADLNWQVGVRRLESTGDTAFVAGVSLPLGTRARARLDESIEDARLAQLGTSRDSTILALETLLIRTHAEVSSSVEQLSALESQVLPKVSMAAGQAQRAYGAGALSYFESMQLQNEVAAVELELLGLRFDVNRQVVELQRLTGEPIVASSAGGINRGEKK